MISEHQFSTHYSSVWRTVTPLSDGFWSFENKQAERIDVPLAPFAPKELRAVINEAAFRAFCDLHPHRKVTTKGVMESTIESQFSNAIEYVGRFSNAPAFALRDIDASCRVEALSLVVRLLRYFPDNGRTVLRPKFKGCGLLSECEGDLIDGDCLYEVKAGDRPFRVLDLRQLLTYSALAYASNALSFSRIGLFNPRTGVAWSRSLEEVCQAVAGLKSNDTLSSLVEQFSDASVSR